MDNYIVGYFATLIFGVMATWVSGLFVEGVSKDDAKEGYLITAYVSAIIATALLAGNIAIVLAIIRKF